MVNEKWITDEIMALKQGGSSKAHASTHGNTGTDRVTLDASQITSGVFDAARIPSTTDYIIPANANLTKSLKDSSGVYLKYTWELTETVASGKPKKWVSELTSNYLERKFMIYDSNDTLLVVYRFTRVLDSDGDLVSETKVA